MTNTNLLRAMEHIDPKLIADAAPDIKRNKAAKKAWIKWISLAACFCLVFFCALTINNNIHHKSEKPSVSIFEGEVIAIIDHHQCIVEVTVGDQNLLEGVTAYIAYEKIVYSSETYNEDLIIGNTVVIAYDPAHLKKENEQIFITTKNIELTDKSKFIE